MSTFSQFTGEGDTGDTTIVGRRYRKGHPVVVYHNALEDILAHLSCIADAPLPAYSLANDMVARLMRMLQNKQSGEHEFALQEVMRRMLSEIVTYETGLKPIGSALIASSGPNAELIRLRAAVRRAECCVVGAYDQLDIEGGATELMTSLGVAMKALNAFGAWVGAMVALYSCNIESGNIPKSGLVSLLTEKELIALNEAEDTGDVAE